MDGVGVLDVDSDAGSESADSQSSGRVQDGDLDAVREETDGVCVSGVVIGLDSDVGGLGLVDDAAEGRLSADLCVTLVTVQIGVVADHAGLHDGGDGPLDGGSNGDVDGVGVLDVQAHGGGGGPEAELACGVEIRDLDTLDEEADAVDVGGVVIGLDGYVRGLRMVDDAAERGPGAGLRKPS